MPIKNKFVFAVSILFSIGLQSICHAAGGLPPVVTVALQRSGIPLNAVGAYVQEVNSAMPLVASNDTVGLNPASTMKLVTANAALDLLGPGFTWKTQAFVTGTQSGDVLNGDLIIKGSGDPKLVTENLWLFLRHIRASGIREIRGNLILDRSAFADSLYDSAQFDGDPLKPYNAGPDALLLNYNTFAVHFTPQPEQNRVDVTIEPPAAGLAITAPLLTGGLCLDWQSRLRPVLASGSITFDGSFSSVCGEKTLYLHPYLTSHTDYFGAVFRQLWAEVGGVFAGTVSNGILPPTARLVTEWKSPSLPEAVRDMNKFSNNVMARQLLLTIAAETTGLPATTEHGADAIKSWLASKGIDTTQLTIENGSGLSRIERISAATMGRMLLGAYQSPVMPELMSSLPLVATDGTMRKRLTTQTIAGRAHIKTGSLNDVRAIAGYVLAASGKRYVVVCIINHPNAVAGQSAHDALLQWVYENG